MTDKGHCSHGEFDLTTGCPKCIAEARRTEGTTNIVKVKYAEGSRGYSYYSEDRLQVGDIVMVQVRDRPTNATVTEVNVPESEVEAFKDKVKTIPSDSVIPPGTDVNSPENIKKRIEEANKPSSVITNVGAELIEKAAEEIGLDITLEAVQPGEGSTGTPPSTFVSSTTGDLPEPEPETAVALRPGEDLEAHGYYEEAEKILRKAEAMVVSTVEHIKLVNDDLSFISKLEKLMDSKRKELLEPLKAQSDAIRETYTFLMAPVLEASKIYKDKMLAYNAEQDRIRREQEEINRKRQEAAEQEMRLKGEITESVNLVEVAPKAPKTVRSELGSMSQRDNWKYQVFDFSQLPDAFKMVDNAQLSAIAKRHHDQKQVPGVLFYNEPIITSRAR